MVAQLKTVNANLPELHPQWAGAKLLDLFS